MSLRKGKRFLRLAALLLALAALTGPGWATDYYVKLDGSDEANGKSWDAAFATIEKAVAAATNGDNIYYQHPDQQQDADLRGNSRRAELRVDPGQNGAGRAHGYAERLRKHRHADPQRHAHEGGELHVHRQGRVRQYEERGHSYGQRERPQRHGDGQPQHLIRPGGEGTGPRELQVQPHGVLRERGQRKLDLDRGQSGVGRCHSHSECYHREQCHPHPLRHAPGNQGLHVYGQGRRGQQGQHSHGHAEGHRSRRHHAHALCHGGHRPGGEHGVLSVGDKL